MSDTVRLAWTDDDGVFTFRVAAPGDTPTIDVDAQQWDVMAMLRLNLQQLEAPLVEQARAAEQAWLDSRPRSTLFSPGLQRMVVDAMAAELARSAEFAGRVHRQCPDAKGGLTIDVRLPERYRT